MKGNLTHINANKIVLRAFMYLLRVVQWNCHPEVSELWRWRGITDQGVGDLGSGTREWLFWPTYGHRKLKSRLCSTLHGLRQHRNDLRLGSIIINKSPNRPFGCR